MGRQPFSGYCTTCRRRRVKCDRNRPACTRCLKAGFKCAGYDLPLRVQHHIIDYKGELFKVPGRISIVNPPPLPQYISLIGFQEHIAFSFFFNSYRWAHFWRPLLKSTPGGSSDLIYKASLAVALGYMAKIKKSSELVKQAIELNSYAVNQVREIVTRGSKADLVRMIPIVVGALSIYNHTVDQKSPYVHHYGAQMIAQFCGPTNFQSESNLISFRHVRRMLYCLSLSFKCRTFLSEKSWKEIPFQLTSKTMEDKLFDILVDLPGIAESITDRLRLKTEAETIELSSIRLRFIRWRNEWQILNSHAAIEVNEVYSRKAGNPLFIESFLSTGLTFQTAQQAMELLHYNAAMLYISHLQYVLDGESPDHETRTSVMEYQTSYVHNFSKRNRNMCLLRPSDIESEWQHGIEGLRILANIRGQLLAGQGIYLVAAPIAILYCFSKYIGAQETLLSMISNDPWTEDEEAGLARYGVAAQDASLPASDKNATQATTAHLGSGSESEAFKFKEMYIKASRS